MTLFLAFSGNFYQMILIWVKLRRYPGIHTMKLIFKKIKKKTFLDILMGSVYQIIGLLIGFRLIREWDTEKNAHYMDSKMLQKMLTPNHSKKWPKHMVSPFFVWPLVTYALNKCFSFNTIKYSGCRCLHHSPAGIRLHGGPSIHSIKFKFE